MYVIVCLGFASERHAWDTRNVCEHERFSGYKMLYVDVYTWHVIALFLGYEDIVICMFRKTFLLISYMYARFYVCCLGICVVSLFVDVRF